MDPCSSNQPRFEGLRTLGHGSGNSLVQLVVDHLHSNQHVLIKYIPRGEPASFYKYVLREILNHQQLSLYRHPHIVQFHEVILTPRYLGLVMEHIDGVDLQSYLTKQGGTLSEEVARFLFQQLTITMEFIHKKGKVNRNIKLENVLVVESGPLPLIKLYDFGLSKDKYEDSAPHSQIGIALFTAPEVFLNVQGHAYEGEAVDVWACGVVLYMLLFGSHPFIAESDTEMSPPEQMVRLIENTVKGLLQIPSGSENKLSVDLLRRILVSNPKQRYGIKEIMEHPWFQENLPPGALDLNASCAAINYMAARQSPETIKLLVTTAMQSVGPDGNLVPLNAPSTATDLLDDNFPLTPS